MIKIKVSNRTYTIVRPDVKQFLVKHVPPDDIDIVIKNLITTYVHELTRFNILEIIVKRDVKRNALFILPDRIYTTVGKASADVFIAGVFTFIENQITDTSNMLDANMSFVIGSPNEVIKLLNSLNKRGLKIASFMPPTQHYKNDNNVDLSGFEHIISN